MLSPERTALDSSIYDWLYAQTRRERLRGSQAARMLLDALGQPDRQFESVRVVGTNGKGSTSTMLEAGLRAAGVRTGKFTSPHLHAFEERIVIDGQPLDPQRTADFVSQQMAQQVAQHSASDLVHRVSAAPTTSGTAFFDLALALACQQFAASGVQWAVMEAGVGGQSDATQALFNVRAVALTNVALDHTATLGADIATIARDKAGAALYGVPLLTTAQGEALEVIEQVARERGAPLYTPGLYPLLFSLPALPALAGPHQMQNAALALATLRVLKYNDATALHAALQATYAGRLETFEVRGRRLLLDGAHNPHAAQALAQAVGAVDTLIFGNFARKDTPATLAPLLAITDKVVFTSAGDTATDPYVLAAEYGGQAISEPHTALRHALSLTPVGGTLLVAGSLYLVATLRQKVVHSVETVHQPHDKLTT